MNYYLSIKQPEVLQLLLAYEKAGIVLILFLFLVLGITPLIAMVTDKPAPVSAVRSFSMSPVLTRGDLVVVLPTGAGYEYKTGQVVVFRNAEHGINDWTMHRIIAGDADRGFITRGDANRNSDQDNRFPLIKPEWIAGVAPSIGNQLVKVPYLGYPILYFNENLKNPFLLSVLLLLLALLILWKPGTN